MEILGIGPLELLFILLIALIVLGPTDMVKAGRTMGSFLRKIVTSPTWRTIQKASRDIRYLPNKLMRDSGLDELEKDLQQMKEISQDTDLEKLDDDLKAWKDDISSWTTPPTSLKPPEVVPDSQLEEPSINTSDEIEEG
jgi:Sec-independent protein translocase protein TatA